VNVTDYVSAKLMGEAAPEAAVVPLRRDFRCRLARATEAFEEGAKRDLALTEFPCPFLRARGNDSEISAAKTQRIHLKGSLSHEKVARI
jgi:hypothetical protein